MLRNISKTLAGTVTVLGLVVSLAAAQTPTQTPPKGQPQKMTCSKVDGKGDCVAARHTDGCRARRTRTRSAPE